MAQEVETKFAEFKEMKVTMGNLLVEEVMKESLEKAKGSIVEMIVAHDKLKDVYT